jgi:hypothetical protein
MELPYCDCTGRLEKTLAAFGEFLNIHDMSLSAGDSRVPIPQEATGTGFDIEVGRGGRRLKGN